MINEPVDNEFGIPMSEWIARIPNELEADAVGMWQLVSGGRDRFSLSGDDLEIYIKKAIFALLERGALPVRSNASPAKPWVVATDYGNDMESIANNIISEWQGSGADPDHDGLWFALMDE